MTLSAIDYRFESIVVHFLTTLIHVSPRQHTFLHPFRSNMAQALAPYNNAMRLGQGFNSYTQQICLDRAVGRDPEQKAPPSQEEVILHKAAAVSSTDLQKIGDGAVEDRSDMIVYPWVKPQIVTYSSRFVDKLSDVTGQSTEQT